MALQCRFCKTSLSHTFVDLGMSPLSNAYLKPGALQQMEPFYPLHAYVCDGCFLVQLGEFESPETIFSDYAYFSSYSDSWLGHARQYTQQMIERFNLGPSHQVVELASNDGYLLQYFKEKGIPVLGIEPAGNVARVAQQAGIPTLVRFFGTELAQELVAQGTRADLLLGNNVLAHVPDLMDFVAGMKQLLKPDGLITMEFPHLLQLMRHNQFDTIYHEHFSYFSFTTVQQIFHAHGLTLFDVEELPTHGGSLRIFACHRGQDLYPVSPHVEALIQKEKSAGLGKLQTYLDFHQQAKETKRSFLTFLLEAKRAGKSIAAYGAPAKGNTLLNYCGVREDFIDYTVDRNPHKQGCYLPGIHIPIFHPDKIFETRPDYVLILPWNLQSEIAESLKGICEWGGRFVVPIPQVELVS